MARPAKRRMSSGRITPKGTQPSNYTPDQVSRTGSESLPGSSVWVIVMLFFWLGLGVATIVVNYLGVWWDTSNVVLLLGLGFMLVGLLTATRFR